MSLRNMYLRILNACLVLQKYSSIYERNCIVAICSCSKTSVWHCVVKWTLMNLNNASDIGFMH